MKFYIATRFNRKDEVEEIHDTIVASGHEYLSTWTTEKQIKPYEKNEKASRVRAIQSIEASNKCDVFVLLTDAKGTGMYVELGTAILSQILQKKPKIYVAGSYTGRSMFYFHPAVKRVGSFEDVLKDLNLK